MWVSRKEWDKLQKRVHELECKVAPWTAGFDVYAPISEWPYGPKAYISFQEAIYALAAKIGMRFEYREGVPKTAVLVKAGK